MTTTIGRAVFQNAPSSAPSWDGDTLTLNINISVTSRAQAQALTQQVQGLANNEDEPVVPVTSTDDPTLDGFYVVEGVNVEPPRNYLFNNLIRCAIGLRRVSGGYALPQTEILSGSFTRVNFDALTGTGGIIRGINAGPGPTRTTTTGTVDVGAIGLTPIAARPFFVPARDHFIGACEVQYQYVSGGSWYVVNGRQAPSPVAWRITNGFIRFTPGTNGILEVWDGTTWETCASLRWGSSGLAALSDFAAQAPQIVRNGPERVTVRTIDIATKLDATFSLGRAMASFEIATASRGVAFASATASTLSGTHILHQTANDANGNRVVLGAIGPLVGSHTTSIANGAVYVSGAASLMVGVNLGGSGAVTPNRVIDVVEQWIGVTALRQRIVTR